MAEERNERWPEPIRWSCLPTFPMAQGFDINAHFLGNGGLRASVLQPATLQMLGERCRRRGLGGHWNC